MLVRPFNRTANHVTAAKVLEVIGKRAQRRDDIVDVGDALLPFRLLALAARKLIEIDADCHW